jgi:molecular chaperone GrpE
MSEKEKHDGACGEDETCKNGAGEQPAAQSVGQESPEEPAAEEKAEPTWEEKYTEAQDKYLRLVAEFDNYRKRTARERIDLIMTAGEETIKGLLNILDDFERAIKASETAQDVEAIREGTKLIHQKLTDYLGSKGLKPVESEVGSGFDTDLHDAVTKFPAPDEAHRNKIIDTVQKGYKLNDKVIRYAKVVVGE